MKIEKINDNQIRCTLTKEENEDNRDYILAKGGFTLEKEQKFLRKRPSEQLRIRSRISGTMWHPVSGSSGAERRT